MSDADAERAQPDGAPRYPTGTVRALLDGPHVSAATRAALAARLAGPAGPAPRFLDAPAYATLDAACARLVPDSAAGDGRASVPVAAMIDERLASGAGDGWRYATMPPDGEAFRLGLAGIDEHARAAFGSAFVALDAGRQDAVLGALQRAEVRGPTWERVPAARFFEELLAEAVECHYSHPLAQELIGYVGMADLPAWTALGLDALDAREPRALEPGRPASARREAAT